MSMTVTIDGREAVCSGTDHTPASGVSPYPSVYTPSSPERGLSQRSITVEVPDMVHEVEGDGITVLAGGKRNVSQFLRNSLDEDCLDEALPQAVALMDIFVQPPVDKAQLRELCAILRCDDPLAALRESPRPLSNMRVLEDKVRRVQALVNNRFVLDNLKAFFRSVLEVYADPQLMQRFLDCDQESAERFMTQARVIFDNREVLVTNLLSDAEVRIERGASLYPILCDLHRSPRRKFVKMAIFQTLWTQLQKSHTAHVAGQRRCIRGLFERGDVQSLADRIFDQCRREGLNSRLSISRKVPTIIWMAPERKERAAPRTMEETFQERLLELFRDRTTPFGSRAQTPSERPQEWQICIKR